MRGLAICGGIALLEQFHFVIYVLGVLLLVLAFRIWRGRRGERRPRQELHGAPGAAGLPGHGRLHGHHWFVTEDGRRYATPLFLCLAAIVFADIAFAIDSIPAAFAITRDPLLIWMGNVFALLGLRALFVLVEGLMRALPLPRRDHRDRARARRGEAPDRGPGAHRPCEPGIIACCSRSGSSPR